MNDIRRPRRAFRFLFWSSTVSNLGDGIVLAAFPVLAVSLTSDPRAIALVTAAATAPWLLFGLPAGAVADRVDRLRLMFVVDVWRAGVVGALALLLSVGADSLLFLYVTVFALGAAETLYDSAAMAVLPAVVDEHMLERANGRLFAGQITTNQFLGPPLGALAFTAARGLPAVLDAVSFAASAALLVGLRPQVQRVEPLMPVEQPVVPPPAPRSPARGRLRAEVREGLRFVWQHPNLRLLAIGAGVINFAETAAMAVAVLFATATLGLSASGYGVVLGVSAVGALSGALAAEHVVARLGGKVSIVAAVATIAAGLAMVAAVPTPATFAVGLAFVGVAAQVWNVVAVSYRQRGTPAELRARVMSAYRFVAYGAFPLGAMVGGVVATAWGERTTFVAAAVVVAVLASVVAARLDPIDCSTT